jgi:hypothetical protein
VKLLCSDKLQRCLATRAIHRVQLLFCRHLVLLLVFADENAQCGNPQQGKGAHPATAGMRRIEYATSSTEQVRKGRKAAFSGLLPDRSIELQVFLNSKIFSDQFFKQPIWPFSFLLG